MRSGFVCNLCLKFSEKEERRIKMTKKTIYLDSCVLSDMFDVQPWYEVLWLIWWYVMLILTYHHTMAGERTTTAFSDCVIQHLTSNRDSGFCHFLVMLLHSEGPLQDLMSMKLQEGALYMTGMWFCVFSFDTSSWKSLYGRQYSSAPKAVWQWQLIVKQVLWPWNNKAVFENN